MSTRKPAAQPVRIRILVVSPPAAVRFAVQRGRSELLEPSGRQQEAVRFDLSLGMAAPRPDGSFNFVGEFAQGPPADRFIYINSGTLAGQADTPWTRRAKLKLASIPRHIVEAALATGEGVIEARVTGTMADGGPVCASVPPHAVVWSHVRDEARSGVRATARSSKERT